MNPAPMVSAAITDQNEPRMLSVDNAVKSE